MFLTRLESEFLSAPSRLYRLISLGTALYRLAVGRAGGADAGWLRIFLGQFQTVAYCKALRGAVIIGLRPISRFGPKVRIRWVERGGGLSQGKHPACLETERVFFVKDVFDKWAELRARRVGAGPARLCTRDRVAEEIRILKLLLEKGFYKIPNESKDVCSLLEVRRKQWRDLNRA